MPGSSRPSKKSFSLQFSLLRGCVMLAALAVVAMMLDRVVALTSEDHSPMIKAFSGQLGSSSPSAGKSRLPRAVSDAMAHPAEQNGSSTIVITGRSGTIVGQLAKIPAQNEQITEMKPVSEVDNEAGRELLSIIGKY